VVDLVRLGVRDLADVVDEADDDEDDGDGVLVLLLLLQVTTDGPGLSGDNPLKLNTLTAQFSALNLLTNSFGFGVRMTFILRLFFFLSILVGGILIGKKL